MSRKGRMGLVKRRDGLMRQLLGFSGLIRGSLVETRKKCGRKTCSCEAGDLHPHRYLSTSVSGKTRVVYVRKEEMPDVRKAIRDHRRVMRILESISQINIRLLKEADRR